MSSSSEPIYSICTPGIKTAAIHLVNENSEELIRYLYNHTEEEPFTNPAMRVGLSLRILVKVNKNIDEELIQRILRDIESLRSDREYLESFGFPKQRYQALQEEYLMVQKFVDWEDKITLNTRDENEVDEEGYEVDGEEYEVEEVNQDGNEVVGGSEQSKRSERSKRSKQSDEISDQKDRSEDIGCTIM